MLKSGNWILPTRDSCPLIVSHMRLVPTKWETSRKISFPSYNQIHVAQTQSFKMVYYVRVDALFWVRIHYSLRNSFVFCWFLECSLSHISFNSLETCRSFCENRSHMWRNQMWGWRSFRSDLGSMTLWLQFIKMSLVSTNFKCSISYPWKLMLLLKTSLLIWQLLH